MMFKQILILSILLTIFSTLSAQKELEDINYNTQTISHSDYSERIEFIDNDKKVKTQPDIEYYWLKNQKVLSTQGGYSGKLLHGNYEAFYPNKNLKEKGEFDYGLKNGNWVYWRNNGTLDKKEVYKKGRLEDVLIIYTTQGKDSILIPYKNGQKNGKVYEVLGNEKKHIQTYHKGQLKKDRTDKVLFKWNKKNADSDISLEENKPEKLSKKEKKEQKKLDKEEKEKNKNNELEEASPEKKGIFKKSKKEDSDPSKAIKEEDKKEREPFFKRIFKKDKNENKVKD